jgi:hypothetical protein
MQAPLLIAVEKIKARIKEHNLYNDTSRRTYSEDIKKSVIDLCDEFHLSPGKVGKFIGVSEVLISKWRRNGSASKKGIFRSVSVVQDQKQQIIIKHTSGFYFETDFDLLDLILLKIKSL